MTSSAALPLPIDSQLELVLDAGAVVRRRQWKDGAARLHFGVCGKCGRVRDDNGKPLLVARQSRARRFLCFECASPRLRNRRKRT